MKSSGRQADSTAVLPDHKNKRSWVMNLYLYKHCFQINLYCTREPFLKGKAQYSWPPRSPKLSPFWRTWHSRWQWCKVRLLVERLAPGGQHHKTFFTAVIDTLRFQSQALSFRPEPTQRNTFLGLIRKYFTKDMYYKTFRPWYTPYLY